MADTLNGSAKSIKVNLGGLFIDHKAIFSYDKPGEVNVIVMGESYRFLIL